MSYDMALAEIRTLRARILEQDRLLEEMRAQRDMALSEHSTTMGMLNEQDRAIAERDVLIAEMAADKQRLDFMAEHEAWIAWSRDGETCRVFHRFESGDTEPMIGWNKPFSSSARAAIDAAILANKETGK